MVEAVAIKEIAYPGKGVSRLRDGCVVFVHGVVEGEEVEVEILQKKKNYAEGRMLRVLNQSPQRIQPVCPLSQVCPGCRYQHVEYAEELRCKQGQLIGLFRKLGGMDISTVCASPVASPDQLGYRNKITLHASIGGETPVLGYLSEDNTSIFDVPDCQLAVPELRVLIGERRKDASFMGVLKPDMAVVFRHTVTDGAVCWVGRCPAPRPWLTENTGTGTIHVPRGAFFQVNRGVAESMLDYAVQLMHRLNPASLVDLYCGVGIFALAARGAGVAKVAGVDVDKDAIEAARANAAERKFDNIEFVAGTAINALRHVVASLNPAGMTLVVDPPRAGLEREMIGEICRVHPEEIIYVSCAPDTLARDAKMLCAAGYGLKSIRLFDMFPRTPYFETVAHFSAGP